MNAPTRDEWLHWRRTGITATDTAGILGLSPYTSPYAVWADKAGLLPATTVTDAMEFGSRAEDMLAGWFHDRTGMFVLGEQTWCTCPDGWKLATVDGFVHGNPAAPLADALGGYEAKTTTDTADEWDDEIPHHIMCQVQWQMAVTGMPRTWLATLHLGFRVEFRVRVIERDEDDIAALVSTCEAFWLNHCKTGIPPMTDGTEGTTRALRAAFPGDEELDAVPATPDLVTARERIIANKERIKTCEAIIADEENLIRAHLGDHVVLTNGTDDKGRAIVLATWKPSIRTSLDAALLKANEPEIAAKYSKHTQTRVLLVKNHTKGK